jgi:fructokinase
MAYALIEGGGTKFVLGTTGADGAIRVRHRLPTTAPEETLSAAVDWFVEQAESYAAVGIACFGPLELDPDKPDWGHMLQTVKPHWSGIDVAGPFASAFACPVGIETDVNGAALAEAAWGAGQDRGSLLYVTVGTGIGGGYVSRGRLRWAISACRATRMTRSLAAFVRSTALASKASPAARPFSHGGKPACRNCRRSIRGTE